MATASHVPAPPQGPGVHPPFPAPPVEGKGKRLGWTIGISIGVVLLICGAGIAAIIGLGVVSQGSYQERAEAAVSSYLEALRTSQYQTAYDLLCDEAQESESPEDFRSRVVAEPTIKSYTIGTFDIVTGTVPVDATYDDGRTAQLEAQLGVDRQTGTFKVCEIGE